MRVIRSGADAARPIDVPGVRDAAQVELGTSRSDTHVSEVHGVGTDMGMTAVVVQTAQLSLASDVVADGAGS